MVPLLQSVGFKEDKPFLTILSKFCSIKRKQKEMEQAPLSTSDTSVDNPFAVTSELFTFSPFGVGCRLCEKNVTIQMDKRSIQLHLKNMLWTAGFLPPVLYIRDTKHYLKMQRRCKPLNTFKETSMPTLDILVLVAQDS
jgi:hypothetical protein